MSPSKAKLTLMSKLLEIVAHNTLCVTASKKGDEYYSLMTALVLVLSGILQVLAIYKGDKMALKKVFTKEAIAIIKEHRPAISGMVPQ